MSGPSEPVQGLFQMQDDHWPTIILDTKLKDRSGAECPFCGHPFGNMYPSGCPMCGNAAMPLNTGPW